ncbi:hypothetical protein BJP39_09280 [Streptomyces sp. CC77]|nr:hypothetical protein BJP39_09280 [Streptomyces sp. CC77]
MIPGVRPYCVHCDRPIREEPVVIPGFSASGARPDAYRHATCRPPGPPPRSHPTGPPGPR